MIDPLTFIALLPAVVLVVYICRKDRTDKEPPALLAKLLGFGALSCLPAIVVELILSAIIERLNVRNVYLGYFLEAFVVAGLTGRRASSCFCARRGAARRSTSSSTQSSMPSWSRSALPRSRT